MSFVSRVFFWKCNVERHFYLTKTSWNQLITSLYIYYHSRLIRSNIFHHENNWFLEKKSTYIGFVVLRTFLVKPLQFQESLEFKYGANSEMKWNSRKICLFYPILHTSKVTIWFCVPNYVLLCEMNQFNCNFISWNIYQLALSEEHCKKFMFHFFGRNISFRHFIAFMRYLHDLHSWEKFSVKPTL